MGSSLLCGYFPSPGKLVALRMSVPQSRMTPGLQASAQLSPPTYACPSPVQMTGRKGRVVRRPDGSVMFESRAEQGLSIDHMNLKEKERFMNGDKVSTEFLQEEGKACMGGAPRSRKADFCI